MFGREFRIAGWRERGRAYVRKGVYAQIALSVVTTGYIIHGICMIIGWA